MLRHVFFRSRQLPIYHRANYIGALARTSRGSIMKIIFFRWVGVDSVAPAPDYLDRQNADCGPASRFYRRGVAFRFQNQRAPSQSRYGTSRRCRPGLDHQSLALSMIRPAPPTSAVVNFSSAAQVSLKSTARISAGQNRSWRGTLTSASAMRSVMERFTPMKLCIRQSKDRDGKFVSTERLRFVTQIYESTRPTAREASENLFRIAICRERATAGEARRDQAQGGVRTPPGRPLHRESPGSCLLRRGDPVDQAALLLGRGKGE